MAKFAFVLDAWCEKATELKRHGVTSLSPVGEGEVTTQSLSLDESGGHAGESRGIGRQSSESGGHTVFVSVCRLTTAQLDLHRDLPILTQMIGAKSDYTAPGLRRSTSRVRACTDTVVRTAYESFLFCAMRGGAPPRGGATAPCARPWPSVPLTRPRSPCRRGLYGADAIRERSLLYKGEDARGRELQRAPSLPF